MSQKILIIDDERAIRASLRDILEYEHYHIEEAESAVKALEILKHTLFDVIFCDIKMPQMDGLEFLEHAKSLTDAPIIMISGHGTIDTAVEALKKGAYDFIEKPLDLNRLLVSVRNALERKNLVTETKNLKTKIQKTDEIIGDSPEMKAILDMADKVAPSDARVLICGENGTGKELLARRIHNRSLRANHPLIEVNCAAIPSELIESELFGHEKGSFTSAIKQRKGFFEQANGGTLFLDEIGDMSLSAQAKVLRALQENKITRVGGEKDIPVNVRVIAATNKDLNAEIAAGNFREDLFHRISVIILKLPNLNSRISDLPELVNHFINEICKSQGKPNASISEKALQELSKRTWTGNIRELRNIVERLVILCDKTITDKDVKCYAG
ncbi:MAG: sigma-54 dependent transcriptional regulator [Bacteroidales bacterium]|jgi:DNA-binding NtrC family response regulator|nr:sigma-54 dependent transcriptional regulator [Bacteroidales bacterium]